MVNVSSLVGMDGEVGAARGEKMGVGRGISWIPALPSFLIWSVNSNGAKKGKGHQEIEVTRVGFVDVGRMNPSLAVFGGGGLSPSSFLSWHLSCLELTSDRG